ncbi:MULTISPECIES: alpha-ketoacid dehydrogenase subunit beta [Actinomadura]|uniref:Alpha-ketoacid dehydrogenase subunit beta n=1 Tax=Actinomadura litoris TaxID=2678616 RepID=A0A7K1KYL1_9ACTN|nr:MULTISPECIES: alpha-ketoacid dehydrogenase subunit beta [Actinomadura]MBT2212269.1 alpha-ketoacid dehydrogenase subunit beta [Actinomadura sp. NEAU-AAG7]MUN37239.1 alpha-ketoacid dehydrogenase subunit beta [Actinomadura litoris]
MREVKYAEAVRGALEDEMAADETVVVMGEEVGALGGVFTVTQGLLERFGEDRVLDSPISEAGVVGFAIGAAAEGMRPVVEIMFSDFVLLALDQIINLGAKIRYMSNGQFSVPLTIRMPGGGGTNHGPQHSQSLESLFAHVPGLVVAMPSNPSDAYWMLRHAIRSDDPVIFLESKNLYFRTSGDIDARTGPDGFGASVVRAGDDITIVSAGRMVERSLQAADRLAAEGVGCEVIDLRYLWPLDTASIEASLRRTGKLAVVYEAVEFCGWGGEVAAWAGEHCFESLDGPVVRVGTERVPIPYGHALEDEIVPTAERIAGELRGLAAY